MSIYLTIAMQLFGRAQDRLSHVLVSEHFETHADFYYIPPTPRLLDLKDRQGTVIGQVSTAQAMIDLADIPYIRLRGVMSDWMRQGASSYSAMVQRAQEDLNLLEGAHTLRINVRNKTVAVASRQVTLTAMQFFLYALLADLRQQGRGDRGFVTLDEITVDDLDTVFRRVTAAKGNERGLDDYVLVSRFGFLDNMIKHAAGHLELKYEHVKKTLEQQASKIKRKFEAERLPNHYLITTRGERGALQYGLDVAPEWIVWEGVGPS